MQTGSRPSTPRAGHGRLGDKWWQVTAENYDNQFTNISVDHLLKYYSNEIDMLYIHNVIVLYEINPKLYFASFKKDAYFKGLFRIIKIHVTEKGLPQLGG